MSLSTEISKGGEEIFESVPEESEKSSSTPKAEVETPEIERLSIDVTKAFEVFQGKLYLPGGAGSIDDRVDYILEDSRGIEKKSESPLQRFARLRVEIDALQADLDSAVKSVDENSMWKVLQSESAKLRGKLLGLDQHRALVENGANRTFGLEEKMQELLVDIDQYPKVSQSSTLTVDAAADGSVQDSIISLERRITGLEKLIGSASSSIDRDTNIFPLDSTLSRLEHRVNMLDEECLDKIHKKSVSLKREIEILNKDAAKSKELLEAAEKVDGMRKKMDSVVSVADCLPDVILRFKSLESVHQTASHSAARISAVEENISLVKDQVLSNSNTITVLKKELKANIEVMKENMRLVDERVTKAVTK